MKMGLASRRKRGRSQRKFMNIVMGDVGVKDNRGDVKVRKIIRWAEP